MLAPIPRGEGVFVVFADQFVANLHTNSRVRDYIGTIPSRKKIRRLCREISEMTRRRWTLLAPEDRVARLNRMLVGWANYFCLGPVSKAYRTVDAHARYRLRQWLCAKYKVKPVFDS